MRRIYFPHLIHVQVIKEFQKMENLRKNIPLDSTRLCWVDVKFDPQDQK